MHLHGEEHSETASDRGSECDNKMTTSAVDVRLRRQTPVSVKPPRLRLSATTTTSSAANKMSISRHSAGSAQIQGRNSTSSSSASNNRNNNTCDGSSRKILDGTMERVVTRSSRSSSVSKISGSTSCGRRIRGRASRAGITASTFTPATSSADMTAGFGSGSTQSLSKSVATGLSRSCENVRTAVFSTAALENGSGPGRPLIHHQRHNLKNRFQLLKTLGEGTYGKVKLAMEKSSGEQVAIKYIKKTKIVDGADLARIRREIQILSSLRHSHVVNIREVFEKKDKIVLVMDYAQGGELYDYLNKMGRLGEWEARRIFRQIVSAIHCCHQNGIVHRDLKLENIILDDAGNVKIADFGLANYYSHSTMLSTFCGSPLYASPEIVNGRSYYGPEVDVWSLGVILYTLVYGSMPFESNSLVSLKQQISDGDYRQPSKPSDAAGLIRHMLTVTPSRRATMDDALRHWWVNFGHPHMPNGQAYNPCELDDTSVGGGGVSDVMAQGSPTVSLSSPVNPPETSVLACPPPTSDGQNPLTTDTGLVSSQFQRPRCHSLDDSIPAAIGKEFVIAPPQPLPPPPAIIHQRNQSSLSSDSDAELELLRSSRWDQSRDVDRSSGGTTQPHPPLQRRRGWRFGHHKTGSGPLDSTGNSVNSSGSASPASNTEDNAVGLEGDDSYQRQTYSTMESQVNACSMVGLGENFVSPNVLKLPPALMDILGGCSEKSLTALLTPDPDTNFVSFNPFDLLDDPNSVTIKRLNSNPNCSNQLANPTVSSSNVPAASPSLESNCVANTSDVTNNNVHSSPHVGPIQTPLATSTSSLPCPSTTTSSTADPFVFDSERKPKRSILKRRGKFSGPDPAKKTENGQKDVEEDNHIPKSGGGHLPRRLPSFRDEAHGIFASKHRASQLLEEAAGTLAPESCSSALVHSHNAPWGKHSETDSVTSGASPLPYVSLTAEDFHLTSPLPQRTTHPEPLSQREPEFTTIHISPPIPSYPQSTASVPDQCSPNGSHLGQLVPADLVSSEAAMINSKNFDSHTLACHDKPYNADLANGNYSDLLKAPLQNGYSLLSDSCDAHSITALADGQVTKAAVDNLISPFLSDLSIVCQGNSNPTPAKSHREIATCLEAKTTTQGDCSANSPVKPQSANPSHRSSASNSSGDSAYESSSLSSHPTALLVSACSSSSSNGKVVRRSSNILRSSQLEQARNRLSVSSIGSNSSADILDLSYDSGDGEHFVNLEREVVEQAASHKLPGADDMDTHVLPDKTSPPGLDTLDILTGVPNDESTSPGQQLETVKSVKTVSTTELMDPWTGVSQQSAQFVVSENVDLMIFPDDEEEGPVKFDGAELPTNEMCQVAMENTSPTSNELGKGNACDVGNFLDCGKVNGEDQTWETKTVSPGLDLLQDVTDRTQDQTDRPDQVTNITESCSPLLYRLAREAQTWL